MKFVSLLLFLVLLMYTQACFANNTEILGYFDFEYSISELKKNSGGDFDQHHLSIILQEDIDIYRFFAEVEYEHSAKITDNQGGKGVNGNGKVLAERAWTDILLSDHFKIRAGRILTPTLWQSNHYPNFTYSVSTPSMVESIFKDAFTGLMLYGDLGGGLSYHIWTMRGDAAESIDVTTGPSDAIWWWT